MKFLSLLATSFITISAFAQQPTSLQLAKENRLSNLSINKPIDNMPSANVGPSQQIFLYNNSLDVYKSQPDNMPLVKPDGTYKDEMSSGRKLDAQKLIDAIKAYKTNQFQPSGNTKFNFVMPAYQDSLPYIDSTKRLLLKPKF